MMEQTQHVGAALVRDARRLLLVEEREAVDVVPTWMLPGGLVLDASRVPAEEALRRLSCVAWYDCTPLERYLSGAASGGATYRFEHR